MPGGNDGSGIRSPDEGLWRLIVLGDEAFDGGLEVDDGSEHAVPEASAGQDGEEALDGVQPRTGCRREVEGPARVTVEPGADLLVLVGGVVVEDHVDDLAGRDFALEGVEEADELLMAMALHVAPEHLAGQHVERREERGRAVAFVVVGHGRAASLLHRQTGLGPVESLDLRLLVD